jgi:hypothetical protein
MSNTNTSGPAFPTTVRDHYDPETGGQWSEHVDPGMTLRDYFAAKAMQVVLYQCDCFPDQDWRMGVALDSYMMADAMLKAREQ